LVINWSSSNDATLDTYTRIWRILWLNHYMNTRCRL
jgi:hypothetical protein